MKTLYLFRTDLGNPGDMWSSPRHYLKVDHRGPMIDVHDKLNELDMRVDVIVVGGGALLTNDRMIQNIELVLDRVQHRHLVVWGVGKAAGKGEEILARANLWGIRDWFDDSDNAKWVPCVSCLHTLLQNTRKIQASRDFLVIDHWKRQQIAHPGRDITRIKNNPQTMEVMVQEILRHRWVITSSYHAAYWAILLNREVAIVSAPWQSKLDTFKWKVPCAEEFSWKLLDRTQPYPDALDEAIHANADFMRKYDNLIASP